MFTEADLVTSLTDAQLEKAALVPCTQKTNRSLLETVRLSHQLKMEEQEILQLSAPLRDLISRSS